MPTKKSFPNLWGTPFGCNGAATLVIHCRARSKIANSLDLFQANLAHSRNGLFAPISLPPPGQAYNEGWPSLLDAHIMTRLDWRGRTPEKLKNVVTLLLKKLFLVLSTRLSDHGLADVLLSATRARVEKLAPADALKFLFNLDAELYPLQGWTSVAYGGGLHTKHRHTKYHDFFTKKVRRGERVLDLGCGNGALSRDVAEKSGAHVVGIDLNPDNIDTAKKKYSHSRVTYEIGDVLTTNVEGSFDTVIMSNVLEHLDQRAEFLHRVTERIKPRRFLLRVPAFERDWRVPLKAELGIDYRLDPTHFIEYTLESFAEEIALAGLTVVHQEVRWGEIWAEAVPGNKPEFSQE